MRSSKLIRRTAELLGTPSGRTGQRTRACSWALAALLVLAAGTARPAHAQTYKVLYSFAGYPTDGSTPEAGLVMDSSGNLYGTTTYGGNVNANYCGTSGFVGCGTVFKLDTNGVETVLLNFGGQDGVNPSSSLTMDAKGDLFGTTKYGGNLNDCNELPTDGCGVVFKLSGGRETVLHRFTGGGDGAWPWAGVIMDTHGALYGTTNSGGTTGNGVAYKLVGTKETVLHSFCSWPNCEDGGYITAGLIIDPEGSLYGTAAYGGDMNCNDPDGAGCGVVFKLSGRKETVLHAFKGPPDGDNPWAGALFMDASGNLYGTTYFGGTDIYSVGTVFAVSASGKEHVLHDFSWTYQNMRDGKYPFAGVICDADDNIYGTTSQGGRGGGGIVYEITTDRKEKILHSFCSEKDCIDGLEPWGNLIMDSNGNLYGTTNGGGAYGYGTIFMITP